MLMLSIINQSYRDLEMEQDDHHHKDTNNNYSDDGDEEEEEEEGNDEEDPNCEGQQYNKDVVVFVFVICMFLVALAAILPEGISVWGSLTGLLYVGGSTLGLVALLSVLGVWGLGLRPLKSTLISGWVTGWIVFIIYGGEYDVDSAYLLLCTLSIVFTVMPDGGIWRNFGTAPLRIGSIALGIVAVLSGIGFGVFGLGPFKSILTPLALTFMIMMLVVHLRH